MNETRGTGKDRERDRKREREREREIGEEKEEDTEQATEKDNDKKKGKQNNGFKFYPGTGDEDDVAHNVINVPIAPVTQLESRYKNRRQKRLQNVI